MDNSQPLRLTQISKNFGAVQALKPLDLHVEPQEMIALLGPSGCGKTTTLRIIAGFENPDTGSVHIGDRDVTDLPPHRRGLGMVFQNYSLFPHMTVGENIAFGLKMRGIGKSDRTARTRSALSMVRLAQYEDRSIHQLSGGQQQRIALARSLVTDPAVLLLDEPLGALDKNLRESMQFELREIQNRLGITAIIVTHDQEEALTMSDRVAVMLDGQIVQISAPIDIYERPNSRFVSEFLGTANIFSGRAIGQAGDKVLVTLDENGARIPTHASSQVPEGASVKIAVRPERMRFHDGPDGVAAKVRGVVFRGSYYAYELELPGREDPIYVYSGEREDISADGRVMVTWPDTYSILLSEEVGR
ncbi:ABC transporter ATP-binding protein [Aureimonas populi]|uniref:Spermidine/putrescine import ATP-binding protein PotA n=1 Tax=Aureimonas populi TaxID=1701758 RepID=A0ABW5CLY6_9HYPH|nr:ABC transporter ATP-binding protein [Aureimonas populi]